MVENLCMELENQLFQNIRNSLNDPNFHDVYLKYTNHEERIPSVKFLLKLRSEYFKRRIQPDDTELHLIFDDNIHLDIFRVLHNSVLPLDNLNDIVNKMGLDDQFRLFILSDFYKFKVEEEVMKRHFLSIMTRTNCWELLELSYWYASGKFGDACAYFISQRIDNLESNRTLLSLTNELLAFLLDKDTFILDEERIFNIALKW